MIQFKKREIVFIFIMFIGVATLVFSIGIFIGGTFVGHEFKSAALKKENPLKADSSVSDGENEAGNVETTDVSREIPPLRSATRGSAQGRDDSEILDDSKTRDDSETLSQAPELRGFTIQVSAVEDRQMALMEAERLKGLGFPTVSIEDALMENRKWFFVNLGYFQNEKKAFTLASRLRKKGILSSFLIRKSESQVHEED